MYPYQCKKLASYTAKFIAAVGLFAFALLGLLQVALAVSDKVAVGKTFWVDGGEHPIYFVALGTTGTQFGAALTADQSFTVNAVIQSGSFTGEYQITLNDGRSWVLYREEFQDRFTTELWKAADKTKQRIYLTPPTSRTPTEIAKAVASHRNAVRTAADARRAAAEASKAAWLARPEARLGMTTSQVIASRQGSPTHINRTQSLNHVSEQWVYEDGSLLYFENGLLTTVQTTR